MAHTEGIELTNANRNSTFGFYDAADSCSKIGDSVSASLFLMKVDPYTLLFEKLTPKSIDTYLVNNLCLTKSARIKYKALFTKTFNAPKSAAYNKMKQMCDEEEEILNENIAPTDTPNLILHYKRKRATDSVHFASLYDYAMQNGWPSIKDGSIYACVIAMHDHNHHLDYIPLLKQAVLKGDADLEILRLIQYWSLKEHRHLDLKTLVTFYDYAVFDANEMLHYELPKCLPEIEKVVKDHSPVIGRVIYRAKNNDSIKQYTGGKMEDIFWACSHKLGDDLLKYDNALDPFSKQYRMTGFYGEFWDECDNEKPEMKIYVFYGNKKELNYPSAFDKMLRGNKFVTHSIVFDVNQSTIKPESAVFLKQLSSWLKVNAHVNLIVSGHTDNAGDSTANLKLSLARAEEVKRQLVYLGIDSVRLTTKGCGASQPVQSNNTPLGKARNRRVEFVKQ